MKAPTALRCLSETDDDLESWSSKLSYCVPEVVSRSNVECRFWKFSNNAFAGMA